MVMKANMENIVAQGQVCFAETVSAADYCVRRFADKAQAVEAVAALQLSGIKHVYVGPSQRSNPIVDQPPYELMVPHDSTNQALATLSDPQIYHAKTFTVKELLSAGRGAHPG